jgi:cytochrome P450
MGIHRCLGLNFARLQIAIAFEELLAVATNFRLVDGSEVPRQMGVTYNSPTALRLAFDRR